MSDKFIKIGSDVAPEAGRTDWARVQKLSDKEIDIAIAGDSESYALDTEILGRAGSAYHYEVYRAGRGFRWRLLSGDGEAVASSPDSFRTKAAAFHAIAEVRQALLGGSALAA